MLICKNNMCMTASLPSTVNQLQQREELYLLAVGYYKCGDYLRSRDFVVKCLKVYMVFP
jgi:fission 1 protein